MAWPLHQRLAHSPPYQNIVCSSSDGSSNEECHGFKARKPPLTKSDTLSQSSGHDNSRTSSSTHRDTPCSFSGHQPSQRTSFDWREPRVQYISDLAIHRELQWHNTWNARSLGLHWDIICPPYTTRALPPRYNIVVPDFNSPALHKPVKRLELWTDHPVLACYMYELNWGSVPVGCNPTVLELTQSIYNYLSTPLTDSDLEYVRSTPQNEQLLERARQRRVEEGYFTINDVECKGPFRRSDVLGSHRCFYGIRAVKTGDGKDVLFFNLGPGRVPHY